MTGLLSACVLLLLQVAQVPPPVATAAASAGKAILRGRVIDQDSGRPIAGAVVSLWLVGENRHINRLTTSSGTFEFRDVPAGSVRMIATAGEHRATHVSREFTSETPTGGRTSTLVLKPGEQRDDIEIALARGFAINGRVVDDLGRPLAGVSVLAHRLPARQPIARSQTDDLGEYRMFGLEQGRYHVCADFGRSGSISSRASSRRRIPRSTCYPSAQDEDAATAIPLTDADVEGVEIRAPRLPTLTISGQVLAANGEPAGGAQFWIVEVRPNGGGGSGQQIGADGRFTINNVVAGRYVLSADTGGPARSEGPRGDFEYGEVDLGTITDDAENVVVAMRAPVHVRGRIAFEGGTGGPPRAELTIVAYRRGEGHFPGGGRRPQPVNEDHTFEVRNLFGAVRVQLGGLPRGWIVQSVHYRGSDITDTFTELRNGPEMVEITVSDRGAILTGTVADERGNPAAGARVFMFPADADRRNPQALSLGGVLKDGRFTLPPHRADDYLVLAIDAADAARFTDEKSYEQLAPYAERVTLLENERRSIDLRVVKISDDRKTP
jgi:protocatechuate 3,4-dioxygenase beta subunit